MINAAAKIFIKKAHHSSNRLNFAFVFGFWGLFFSVKVFYVGRGAFFSTDVCVFGALIYLGGFEVWEFGGLGIGVWVSLGFSPFMGMLDVRFDKKKDIYLRIFRH